MVVEGEVIRVAWTRAEISAMREAVELTPYFEGRPAVRDTIREALRPGLAPASTIVFGREAAERFAGRLVTSDLPDGARQGEAPAGAPRRRRVGPAALRAGHPRRVD